MEDKKKEEKQETNEKKTINRIAIVLSTIVLMFGIIYGFWYFNRDSFLRNKNNNNNITEEDINDKNVSYDVKELKIEGVQKFLLQESVFKGIELDTYGNQTNNYYDLDGNLLGSSKYDYFLGSDNYLYKTNYDNENKSVSISMIKKGKEFPVKTIAVDTDKVTYHPLYYVKDDNYFEVGFITEDENGNSKLYIFDEGTIKEYSTKEFSFIGNNAILTTDDAIITEDANYIAVTSGNGKDGIFSIKDLKVVVPLEYDVALAIGNNGFILEKDGKASVYDSNMKSLTTSYDYIEKIYDYYLVAKNKKFALLDSSLKQVTDFTIPQYKEELSYHPSIIRNNGYNIIKLYDGIIVCTMVPDKEEVYELYVYQDKKLNKYTINDMNISNFIYSANMNDRTYTIYDDEYKELYKINIDNYFKDTNILDIELFRYGNTLSLYSEGKQVYLNYKDGKEVDNIADYESSYTDSIKLRVHNNSIDKGMNNNTITLYVGDKEYTDLSYADNNLNGVFRKINNKYYVITDNKIYVISKK